MTTVLKCDRCGRTNEELEVVNSGKLHSSEVALEKPGTVLKYWINVDTTVNDKHLCQPCIYHVIATDLTSWMQDLKILGEKKDD